MISKSRIKFVRSLHQKKYRDESGLFIAEGAKVVSDLLNSKYIVKEVFSTEEFVAESLNRAEQVEITRITENELKQISNQTTPNKVLAVFQMLSDESQFIPTVDRLVLALDDIRDPGNLGTIIRIADWFGIDTIVCSLSCVDMYNPKVVQSAMGSLARVNVCYEDLEAILKNFKYVFAATLDGKNVYSEKLSDSGVILIGNESKGISESLFKYVTHKISIPKFSKGADSLNAAIAASVICSEFKRRNY